MLDSFEAPENGIGLVEAITNHFRTKSYPCTTHFENHEYLRLGTVTDVAARRECPFCRIVTSALDIGSLRMGGSDMYIMWDGSHAAFKVMVYPKPKELSPSVLHLGVRIVLCGGPDHPESTMYWARIPNINGFDSSRVKLWLSMCEERHKSQCGLDTAKFETNMRSLGNHDFRLIDVQQECLVVPPLQSTYLALSYVWGQVEQLQLLKQSYAILTVPGSLARHRDLIPRTVRDAMYFVSLIGEKYLWVDAICLLQDDPQSMLSGIRSMNFIFQNALATIVAADGSNSRIGLQRLHSTLALNSKPVETIKPGLQLMAIGALDVYLARAKWFSRAWT